MVAGAMPSRDAVTRSIDQRYRQAAGLLVGRHVLQFRQCFSRVDESAGPSLSSAGIGVFERVLVLGAAHAVIDRDVLHRLHEQLDALRPVRAWLEPADEIRGADVALFERLEIDRHPAAVVVVLVPSAPMNEDRLATAGSARITWPAPVALRPWPPGRSSAAPARSPG